jgi:uncharacterized OB-fold protein
VKLTHALDAAPLAERRKLDRAARKLIGTRCRQCLAVSWPGRAVCNRCGSPDTAELVLSDRGSLITCTTVWVARPGLAPPYTLAQVDLENGVRVFAHARRIDAAMSVPMPVHMVVNPDSDAVPAFWFEPLEA